MRIIVHAKPNAKTPSVERSDDGDYVVRIDAPPRNGKANERLVEILAEHFSVPKSTVRIVFGKTAREKVIEIVPIEKA